MVNKQGYKYLVEGYFYYLVKIWKYEIEMRLTLHKYQYTRHGALARVA